MLRTHPKTTFTVTITPFAEDGRVDLDAYRRHLGRMRDADMGVYVAGSGSSEAYSLSDAEVDQILEASVEELHGTVPVRAAGWESHNAADMIGLARRAARAGVDAVQIYSIDMGHGVLPTDAELEKFYRDVFDAVDTRFVIATHESAGYRIPLPMLERLVADYPQVIGINCTHSDISYLTRIVDELDPRLEVHIGATQQAFACMALGGTGYLTGEGNLAPRLCRSVTALYESGDLTAAADAFAHVVRLYSAGNGSFASIRGTKAAMAARGLIENAACRAPFTPLTAEEKPLLDRLLAVVADIPDELL
ncbi:MAG TPA: dihydrodipicolinate synthase family protein [Pseudolysinimonas sp.]|jgi:4-hydroxy-tetrahydrodipicolinate synthase